MIAQISCRVFVMRRDHPCGSVGRAWHFQPQRHRAGQGTTANAQQQTLTIPLQRRHATPGLLFLPSLPYPLLRPPWHPEAGIPQHPRMQRGLLCIHRCDQLSSSSNPALSMPFELSQYQIRKECWETEGRKSQTRKIILRGGALMSRPLPLRRYKRPLPVSQGR